MVLDSFQCAQCQGERVSAFQARNRRRLVVADGCYESENLRAQWFNVDDIEVLRVNSRPGAFRGGRRQVADRSVLRGVVDSDVIMWLKKTHLANFFRAYTRGRDVCYCP